MTETNKQNSSSNMPTARIEVQRTKGKEGREGKESRDAFSLQGTEELGLTDEQLQRQSGHYGVGEMHKE